MLLNVVQLSLRSIRSAKLLKPIDLRSTIKCGYGTKWMSRRPVAIVNEHELLDTEDTSKANKQKTKTHRQRPRGNVRREKEKDEMKNEIKESSAQERPYIALNADDNIIRYIVFEIMLK